VGHATHNLVAGFKIYPGLQIAQAAVVFPVDHVESLGSPIKQLVVVINVHVVVVAGVKPEFT